MKKRIVAGMMAAMMMVGAVGCGSTESKQKLSGTEYTIGIAQFAEHVLWITAVKVFWKA